jgi:hypothetical protein
MGRNPCCKTSSAEGFPFAGRSPGNHAAGPGQENALNWDVPQTSTRTHDLETMGFSVCAYLNGRGQIKKRWQHNGMLASRFHRQPTTYDWFVFVMTVHVVAPRPTL